MTSLGATGTVCQLMFQKEPADKCRRSPFPSQCARRRDRPEARGSGALSALAASPSRPLRPAGRVEANVQKQLHVKDLARHNHREDGDEHGAPGESANLNVREGAFTGALVGSMYQGAHASPGDVPV